VEGTRVTTLAYPAPSSDNFILAAHINGHLPFSLLVELSGIPLLYATADSQFNLVGAKAWFDLQAPLSPPTMINFITRLGYATSLQLLLLGETLDTAEALQLGLINACCAKQDFNLLIEKLAQTASVNASTLAVEIARCSTHLTRLQAELLERYAFAYCFTQPDQHEGMQAFLQKRLPRFS
jgi:enoyl-CoA hydratase/carnithine racemase